MKKHLCLFVLLLLALALPCALADATVPQEVLDLCATAHPGYTVAAADGAAGQYALVLTRTSRLLLLSSKLPSLRRLAC